VLLTLAGAAQAKPLPGAPPRSPELEARLQAALAKSPSKKNPRTRHRSADGGPIYTNRLILEQSPYLLQHAHNPVNWFSWSDEAFETARKLGRPVLLSVGYSTCHWCHVMEEQSFEDPQIAEYMNRNYIAIKVDREERPDVDEVYMTAIHAMSGRGGWPMTVWLTPNREPFYGGTYFPPRDAGTRPGFLTVLQRLQEAYAQDRLTIGLRAGSIASAIEETLAPAPSVGVPGTDDLKSALAQYKRRYDAANGGLRSRTKFPSSLPIPLLLRAHRRTGDPKLLEMAKKTLDAMRKGGIYDHLGGGFHRYATESTWTVPHFEKMLYDNALLSVIYLEAYQATGDEVYADVVRDVLAYVAREMTSPEGPFYSATDADSEGEEGVFFVWTRKQIQQLIGPELAPLALDAYGVKGRPRFEGTHYVLRRDASIEQLATEHDMQSPEVKSALAQIRQTLLSARTKREPPLLDDKQLVAWNGLMISGFARAGLVLGEPAYVEQGARAARALLEHAQPDGRLARYLMSPARPYGVGLLDDFAFLIAGLIDLFEATSDAVWLESALTLQRELDAHFWDDQAGGYWISPDDGEKLLVRAKPAQDGAIPSGNSIEAMNLLRLYTLTTNEDYRIHAEMTLRAFSETLSEAPTGHSRMLDALDFMLDRPKEILIVTPDGSDGADPYLRELAQVYLPNRVLVSVSEPQARALTAQVPWLENKRALGGAATAYVCEARVCDLPARTTDVFAKQIRKKAEPYP